MNAPMLVSTTGTRIVRVQFVGIDRRARQYSRFNERNERSGLGVLYDLSRDFALPLQNACDNGFTARATACNPSRSNMLVHVLSLAAKIAFVSLDFAAKRIVIFLQHRTDLFEHAPRGFIGHACFALKLLCGDTAASRGHEIDRVEPSFQRRRGLVIDRVRSWVYVVPAVLAGIGLARGYFVMLRYFVARLAKDTIGIKIVFQPFKASIISGEIALEILECVARHFRAFDFRFCHARILTECIPTVKG